MVQPFQISEISGGCIPDFILFKFENTGTRYHTALSRSIVTAGREIDCFFRESALEAIAIEFDKGPQATSVKA
jgi:hypothetical protein